MINKFKNILIISFFITSSLYACNRGENCFIPEANAGEDKTYYIGSTVTLDGTSSYDPEDPTDSSILSYTWYIDNYIVNSIDSFDPLVSQPSFNYDGYCTDLYSQSEQNCCLDNYIGCSDNLSLDEQQCCLANPLGCKDGLSLDAESCCLNNAIGCDDGVSLTEEECCLGNPGPDSICSDSISLTEQDCCENNPSCSDGISESEQECCENNPSGCSDEISLTEQDCCENNPSCSDGVSESEQECCENNPSCSDGVSESEQECCENNPLGCSDEFSLNEKDCCLANSLSNAGCSDGTSLNAIDCCNDNGGFWIEESQSCSGFCNAFWVPWSSWDNETSVCDNSTAVWTDSVWDEINGCSNSDATWNSTWDEIEGCEGSSSVWGSTWDLDNGCQNSDAIWISSTWVIGDCSDNLYTNESDCIDPINGYCSNELYITENDCINSENGYCSNNLYDNENDCINPENGDNSWNLNDWNLNSWVVNNSCNNSTATWSSTWDDIEGCQGSSSIWGSIWDEESGTCLNSTSIWTNSIWNEEGICINGTSTWSDAFWYDEIIYSNKYYTQFEFNPDESPLNILYIDDNSDGDYLFNPCNDNEQECLDEYSLDVLIHLLLIEDELVIGHYYLDNNENESYDIGIDTRFDGLNNWYIDDNSDGQLLQCFDSDETWTQSSWDEQNLNCLDSNESFTTNHDLVFSLVVNDGDYNSNPDEVIITMTEFNFPPVIDVVTSLTVDKETEFTIDASGTNDESSLTGMMIFTWDYPDELFNCMGFDSSIISCTSPLVTEDTYYTFNLNVTDGVDSSTEAISILVIANKVPFAIPGDNITALIGEYFELDGSSSFDPDAEVNDVLIYSWNIPPQFEFEAGATASSEKISVKYKYLTFPYYCGNDVFNDEGEIPINEESCCIENDLIWGEKCINEMGEIVDLENCDEGNELMDVCYDDEDNPTINNNWLYGGNSYQFSLVVTDGSNGESISPLGEDLFISEYCEHPDDADGRYFEIYNPTSQDISLDNYELWRLNNGGEWGNDGSNTIFSLSEYTIESGKAIAITRKDETNNDAAELIDYQNINYIHWPNFNPGGDDAIGIAYNGQLIDAIGGATDPGSAWEVAGYLDATKDAQIIRKDSVVGGNINEGCLSTTDQGWVETSSCWNLSAGTTTDNSEWVYFEDSDNENPDIPDVDSWNNAGYHYCATCDNFLTVTLVDNNSPTALVTSENGDLQFACINCDGEDEDEYVPEQSFYESEWSALEGSGIVLDASSSSDPEASSLTYLWTSEEDDIVFFSIYGQENTNNVEDPTVVNPTIVIPAGVNEIIIDLEVSDGANKDNIEIRIPVTSDNDIPSPNVDFISMTNLNDAEDVVLEEDLTDIFEGHTVTYSAESSFDYTNTGNLTYSWVLNPPDIDLIDSQTSNVSFITPEYIGEDKSYTLVLTVNDGEMEDSFEENFDLKARMPIINTFDSSLSGNENSYVRLDASSTNNPLGNVDELSFDWTPGANISGYCGSNDAISCNDISCTEECVNDKSIAFYFIDKSIGENSTYTIDVEAENDDLLLKSQTVSIDIDVLAQYPVSNPGIDQDYTCGTIITLYGMRSSDPQEQLVPFGRWESDTVWDDEITSNVIAFYDEESGLISKEGYAFKWSAPIGVELSDDNAVNPTFSIACGDDLVGEELTFNLLITDVNDDLESKSESVNITIKENLSPQAVIANYRIYNEGDEEKIYLYGTHHIDDDEIVASDPVDTLRAMAGESFILYGKYSFDDTPYENLSYTWTPPYGIELYSCIDEVSLSAEACCIAGANLWGQCIDSSGIEVADCNNEECCIDPAGQCFDSEGSIIAIYTDEESCINGTGCDGNYWIDEYREWDDVCKDVGGNTVNNWISNVNAVNPSFTIPSNLCSDGTSILESDCCENNGGEWKANQECVDGMATWTNYSEVLTFNLTVSDGLVSNIVSIPLIYSSYSEPVQPSLFARSENNKIYLYWDNLAQKSIDNLSKYADFQGYKIYRSTDYGQTWGDAIFNGDEAVGWQPYAQYDLSAEQDSTYCRYRDAFDGCGKDSFGNTIPHGEPTFRYDDISGYVSWYDGYYWQNLGSNNGLTQSFSDEDVIDGVDYTYSVTAYDSGVMPDTLQYGHFGELKNIGGTQTWDPIVWNNNVPLYTFKEYVEVDSFYFYKMDYNIIESSVDNGKLMYRLEPPSEWIDNGIVNQSDIENGVKIWETNKAYPISNPDKFPKMYSLETSIGSTLDDKNFVTISPGSYASNVFFPEEDDLDEFIAADCNAIGDGSRFYEIVNESDLEQGFVKLEIQALPGTDIFEGYDTEGPCLEGGECLGPCLYAYKVNRISEPGVPDKYDPVLYLDPISLLDSQNNTNELFDELCLGDNVLNLNPGAVLDCENFTLTEPDYLIECHELSYLDDPDYASNWTDFFDGVRMRFDNSLREEPKGTKGAALKDIYSYPDSTIAQVLSEDDSFYGKIVLKYAQNAFLKKPSYEYQIELSESFIDTAFFNTTGGSANNFNHLEDCGTTFGTLLPFKIKNITTGDYVKVSHSDNGIWNDIATDIPSSFTTPGDNSTHPGSKDCIWSPGEWITFWDDVKVGDSEITEEKITYKLELSFNQFMVSNYKSEVCPNVVDYDATTTYPLGSCVSSDGHVWYASSDIRPSDNNGQGYKPNEWYDDDDDSTELNDNPWETIYPWSNNDKIVVKPQKWFVDGDYWIADMSMLGASEVVTENDISNISVVPNPYIISSRFNESENGNRIRFTNLPQQCTINIYTISGEFVKSINHNDDFQGSVFWNLKNTSGENVAPGLYIYILETDNGLSKVGKFAVVR